MITGNNAIILQEIDNINSEIKHMLERAKSCLDTYYVIAENARTIRKIRPGQGDFWGFVQSMAFDSLILSICKIFEKDKVCDYEQNSIERMIAIIETNSLKPRYPEFVSQFLEKYASEINYSIENNFTIFDFCAICRKFKDKNKSSLDKLKTARNITVAHNDATHKIESTASLADIEEVLEFGYDFYSTISRAYLGGEPVDIKKYKRKRESLEWIFESLGFI